jgi:elongation factor Ts
MPAITATSVKSLRELTGLPMMDCKKALEQNDGDVEAAVRWLREHGKKMMGTRTGRETSSGRIAVYNNLEQGMGAMVELQCESAPVEANDEFIALLGDLLKQLSTGPGAATPEALLAQASPGKPGHTLKDQLDDLANKIREVFRVARIVRIDKPCAGYAHHNGKVGVLLQVDGKPDATLAKDFCMHIAAKRPTVVGIADLDPAKVAVEREILSQAARAEGKPEPIIAKMVEGRMRTYYEEQCLTEQPFVKDDKQTVGALATAAGMKLVRFVHWELGKE